MCTCIVQCTVLSVRYRSLLLTAAQGVKIPLSSWLGATACFIAGVAHGLHSASRVPCALHPDVRIVHPQYKHHEFEWILCVSRAVKR